MHYWFIAIDMGESKFISPSKVMDLTLSNNILAKYATNDQRLAMIASFEDLIKLPKQGQFNVLQKIYFHPRAIDMYFDLSLELSADLFKEIIFGAYDACCISFGFQERRDFYSKLRPAIESYLTNAAALINMTPHTAEGLLLLCEKLRELSLLETPKIKALLKELNYSEKNLDEKLLNILKNPCYFPDLQMQAIQNNATEMIAKFAPNPQVLSDFRAREHQREKIANQFLDHLDIAEPENSVVKQYIIQDLRGKYYDETMPDLLDQLEKDYREELELPKPEPALKKN